MARDPPERIKASTARIPHPTQDKEALAVLALNDVAALSRRGRFYYLPELRDPPTIPENQHEPIIMKSTVPSLLYTDYVWRRDEVEEYWQKNDAMRYYHVQSRMFEELQEVNVIAINLLIQASGMSSLSWPANFLASVVIYGPGPWYKLSWMRDWTEKATANKTEDTYTVPMYQTGFHGQSRARYKQFVNYLGKICGADELPLKLRAMLRLSVEEVKDTEDLAPVTKAIYQQSPVNESRGCTWIAGADVVKVLDREAGKEVLSTEAVRIKLEP